MEEKKRDCKFSKDISCSSEFNPDKMEDCLTCMLNISIRMFQRLYAVIQDVDVPIKDASKVFHALEDHAMLMNAYRDFLKTHYPDRYDKFFPQNKVEPEIKKEEGVPYIS